MTDEPRQWQRLIETDDADPLEVLRTVGTYQRYLDAIEKQAVRTARKLGRSWEDVAGALGVKRQSAWAKHGARRASMPAEQANAVAAMRPQCPACHENTTFDLIGERWLRVAASVFPLPSTVLWACQHCGAEHEQRVPAPGTPEVHWERPR